MRSAGNFLAGLNAATLKPKLFTWDNWWRISMSLAGELHMRSNNINKIPHYGKWFGEIEYSGRMFQSGFKQVRWGN